MLTSAATADAECAWVLWTETVRQGGGTDYRVSDAFGSEKACKDARQGRGFKALPKPVFLCLPDTVDPRGLKGK